MTSFPFSLFRSEQPKSKTKQHKKKRKEYTEINGVELSCCPADGEALQQNSSSSPPLAPILCSTQRTSSSSSRSRLTTDEQRLQQHCSAYGESDPQQTCLRWCLDENRNGMSERKIAIEGNSAVI